MKKALVFVLSVVGFLVILLMLLLAIAEIASRVAAVGKVEWRTALLVLVVALPPLGALLWQVIQVIRNQGSNFDTSENSPKPRVEVIESKSAKRTPVKLKQKNAPGHVAKRRKRPSVRR